MFTKYLKIFCVLVFLIGNFAVNCFQFEIDPKHRRSSIRLTFAENICSFSSSGPTHDSSFEGAAIINNLNNTCLSKRQQLKSNHKNKFKMQFFKKCVAPHVEEVKMSTGYHLEEQVELDLLSLQNLKHLHWVMRKNIPSSELLSNYKHLKSLLLNLEFMEIDEYKEIYDVKHEHLKELRLIIDSGHVDTSIILHKTYLSGLKNLELFEFIGSSEHDLVNVELDEQIFQNLKNLSTIILTNGRIPVKSKHFRNLTKLKFLNLINSFDKEFEWISLETLQNNLEHLAITIPSNKTVNDRVNKALANYRKLQIIDIPEESEFLVDKIHKISAFICVQNMTTCQFISDINKKLCPNFCQCGLNRTAMRFDISCQHYDNIPELPIPIIGTTSLQMNNNRITRLPNRTSYGYSEVSKLYLANNQLTNLSLDQLPINLTDLDLRNNRLQNLSEQVLEFFWNRSSSLIIQLSGNPWICKCESQSTINFVLKYEKIKDRESVKCHDPDLGLMVNLAFDLCDPPPNYTNIIITIIGLNVVLIVLILVYLNNKQLIILWLYENGYCLQWITRPEPEGGFVMKNDAFLAFSNVDLKYAEEFVEALENGAMQYKVCYYHRDWLPGESIPECILKSIEESKRTIILMTENFIKSSWGRFEFRSAIKAASENKCKRLIVILYPDVDVDGLDSELKSYLKYNTYMSRDDPHFWRKLMFAMPHKHRNVTADPETRLLKVEEFVLTR